MTILSGMPSSGAEMANALKVNSGWLPPFTVGSVSITVRTSDAQVWAVAGGRPRKMGDV